MDARALEGVREVVLLQSVRDLREEGTMAVDLELLLWRRMLGEGLSVLCLSEE
jgi:hypothetical protein